MSARSKEVGAPAEEASLSVARTTGGNDQKGMAAPSNGQSTCLKQPVATTSKSCAGKSQPTGTAHAKRQNSKAGSPKPIGKKLGTEKSAKSQKHFDSAGGCTLKYIRIKNNLPVTQAALDAANIWILNNSKSIDESEQYYCPTCGQVELTVCGCHIKPQETQVPKAAPEQGLFPRPLRTEYVVDYERGWFHETRSDEFDANTINNASMFDMDNSVIHDDMVCVPMYNYIRLHMSMRYGSRSEKYTHCHKLALKFLELKKTKAEELTTLQTNMVLVTVQKVTDQIENSWLSAEVNPTPIRHFPRAWLRNWWLLLVVRLVIISLTLTKWFLLKPLSAVYSITGLLPLVLTPALLWVGISVRSAIAYAIGYGESMMGAAVNNVPHFQRVAVEWGKLAVIKLADWEEWSDLQFGEHATVFFELALLLIPVLVLTRILSKLIFR